MVEVGGIEPPSETLPVCRNYDYAYIIGGKPPLLKPYLEKNAKVTDHISRA